MGEQLFRDCTILSTERLEALLNYLESVRDPDQEETYKNGYHAGYRDGNIAMLRRLLMKDQPLVNQPEQPDRY
jgi:hypothetical protein